jgi:hypothetical protein
MIKEFKAKEVSAHSNKQAGVEMSMITHSSRISTPTNNQSFADNQENQHQT